MLNATKELETALAHIEAVDDIDQFKAMSREELIEALKVTRKLQDAADILRMRLQTSARFRS